jgi:hypothetical protein
MSTEGFVPTEGLQWLAEVAFSEEQAVPANFYAGLSQHNLIKGDTLDDNGVGWTEVTGTGYERQTIASSALGFTSGADGTDWKVDGAKVTFTAGGADWDAATDWFLATTADDSGVIVACGRLAATRQLAVAGDKLEVTPTINLASTDPNA